MTYLQAQELCITWGVKYTLQQLSGQEISEDKIHLTAEEVMKDWDVYGLREYPELPQLSEAQWEGCLESVIDTVSYELGMC